MKRFRLVALYLLTLFVGLVLQFVQLPAVAAPLWPLWSTLLLAAWAHNGSELPHLPAAVIVGVALDVGFAGTLGQHALALLLTTYVVMCLRPTLDTVPWWQAAVTLVPLWVANAFILTALDHLTHHEAAPALRWWPVASETVLWPLVDAFVRRLVQSSRHAAA